MRLGWWFLLCLPSLGYGKVVTGTLRISGADKAAPVHYMSQFGCSIGTCSYKVRTWIRHPESPLPQHALAHFSNDTREALVVTKLRVMLDEEWNFSHSRADCQQVKRARGTLNLHMPLSGQPGEWVSGSVDQRVRPHFWYFLIDDCYGEILEMYSALTGVHVTHLGAVDVDFEIVFNQVDGSGVSYEHVGMAKWVVMQLAVNVMMLIYTLTRQQVIMKRQGFHLHLIPQVLNFALISSILGAGVHLMYLSKLSSHATGILLETASEIFVQISQVAISSGLILIAFGTTLNVRHQISSQTGILVSVGVGIMHILFVVIDKVSSDQKYKHYSLDGLIGWTICMCRIGLWICFLLGWKKVVMSPDTPASTSQFLRKVLIPSSLYLLSFPSLFICLRIVPAYVRHAFLNNGTFIVQCIAIMMLAETFMRKGEYFKVSVMSQSFLPGGVWRPSYVHYA